MMLKAVGVRDAATIANRSKEFKEVMRQAFADEKAVTLEVLRPPTLAELEARLARARGESRPYRIGVARQ